MLSDMSHDLGGAPGASRTPLGAILEAGTEKDSNPQITQSVLGVFWLTFVPNL